MKFLADRWLQRSQFHHRVRLEKEYALYAEIWESLFILRRDLGSLVKPDQIPPEELPTFDEVIAGFNTYQSIVRRGEPFMHPSVAKPARAITERVRSVIKNLKKIRQPDSTNGSDAESVSRLEDENDTSFAEIEQNYEAVHRTIHNRVGAP
jgi:hypothetical protein